MLTNFKSLICQSNFYGIYIERWILFWQIRKELKKDLLNIYVLPFGMHSYIIGEESTSLCVAEMSIIVYYTI